MLLFGPYWPPFGPYWPLLGPYWPPFGPHWPPVGPYWPLLAPIGSCHHLHWSIELLLRPGSLRDGFWIDAWGRTLVIRFYSWVVVVHPQVQCE